MKLKRLVEQFIEENEIDEQAFLESVSNYSSYGKEINREHDIIESIYIYDDESANIVASWMADHLTMPC